MNVLRTTSIFLIVGGAIVFAGGIIVYWSTTSPYGSVLTMIGLLFLLAAVIMLCISMQYEVKTPEQQVKEYLKENK